MKDNISPEEKLLKLIRGQKKETPPAQKPIPVIQYSLYNTIQDYLATNIRKIIWLVLILAVLGLVYSFLYPWFGLRNIGLPQIKPEEVAEIKKQPELKLKPYEFYASGIKNRNIFNKSALLEAEKSQAAVSPDLTKDINLIGIISGNNPQAIIENQKTKRTYYLNKGQFIDELKIEDIQEGKIIVSYKGEKFELYL